MAYKVKKDPIDKIPKAQFVFWIIVRISMLVCAGYSFIHGDLVMGFESVFCFIFTHLWDMFQVFGNGSFIEEVPPLSQTMLNIIIFIGIVIGSYFGFFDKFSWFDNLCILCRVWFAPFSAMILLALFSAKRGNVRQLLRLFFQ